MPSRFYYKCNTVYIRGSFVYSMRRPSALSCHPPLLPSIHLNKEQRKRLWLAYRGQQQYYLEHLINSTAAALPYIALFSSTLIFPIFHSFFLFYYYKKIKEQQTLDIFHDFQLLLHQIRVHSHLPPTQFSMALLLVGWLLLPNCFRRAHVCTQERERS